MGEKRKPDFSGWATKFNIKCADGRTIMENAFDDDDGKTVPLVWQHRHDSPDAVLGHCVLKKIPGKGIYADGFFNNTEMGQTGKSIVDNADVTALSIYANKLKQKGGEVHHGVIREVSLVLAGANPGASIILPSLEHSDDEDGETEAFIYNDDNSVYLAHSEDSTESAPESKAETKSDDKSEAKEKTENKEDKEAKADNKEKTVKDVFDSMTEEQKTVVYALLGEAMKGGQDDDDDEEDEDDEEEEEVKHNVFDTEDEKEMDTLSHDAMDTMIKDGKRLGSLKESVLEHAEDYGIDGIEWLFPEDHDLNNTPAFIKRETSWVSVVMREVSHTPFSRVRSRFANITEDEARAKGYLKGHMKKNEVFTLLKRSTAPQTIYKKQKLDRDDVIDITDFDVVAWIKAEMREMLDEEIARAILIGDGRETADEDKISEEHVRPIANDADLFTIKVPVVTAANADSAVKAKAFIRAAIKARKDYKGSGTPTLFTTEDMLTEMLLLEDHMGRELYSSEQALATKLRVSKIVTVEVMENHKVQNKDLLMGIIVNLKDYTVGADKGGAVSMFDDFDIDYNQMKYLIETRCSGALTVPYSAIVLTDGERQGTSPDGDVQSSKTTHTSTDDGE